MQLSQRPTRTDPPLAAPVRPDQARALLRAMRPRQWVKNLLVVAAPAAAGVLGSEAVAVRVGLTFVAFCLLASATYLFNDLYDREEDRLHPRKRHRPLASGALAPSRAAAAAVVLAAAGLAVTFAVRPVLGLVAAAYLALTLSYTLYWRHVPVADLAAVAAGFVIRAVAGGVATNVTLSRWFVIVTSFGALFLVAGKRYAELQREIVAREQEDRSRPLRNALYSYTIPYLRFVLVVAASVTVGAYCLWAFERHGGRLGWLYELTILPFVVGLLRYALLLEGGAGEAPEELLFGDRFLLLSSLAWVGLFAGSVYGG